MDTKKRLRMIRLIEKMDSHPALSEKLGLKRIIVKV